MAKQAFDVDQELRNALLARIKAIPEGQIAGIARRAGMYPDRLRKLRAGYSLDIRLETLGRLSRALGEPISYMLGEEIKPGDRPTLLPGQIPIHEAHLMRLVGMLRKISRLTARTAETLPIHPPKAKPRGKA